MSGRICVLGAGQAGEALVAGLISSGWAKPEDIVATVRHQERATELAERHGIETTLDNAAAVRGARIVVIAVKPQDIESLLADVSAVLEASQTVLSIAAAIPTELIERHVGDGVP